MPNRDDFATVFARLKMIFEPYAAKMDVAHDTKSYYLLNTRHTMKNKQPLCFGGVRLGKAYVSFYLMSVYGCPNTGVPLIFLGLTSTDFFISMFRLEVACEL